MTVEDFHNLRGKVNVGLSEASLWSRDQISPALFLEGGEEGELGLSRSLRVEVERLSKSGLGWWGWGVYYIDTFCITEERKRRKEK